MLKSVLLANLTHRNQWLKSKSQFQNFAFGFFLLSSAQMGHTPLPWMKKNLNSFWGASLPQPFKDKMEHINETCWVPLWQLSVWLRDEFSITKAGLDVGWVMCPSWSTCKAGACGEDSQNLADRLQLHCGGGGKQDLAASTRARQPIPGHHHQLDDPWQHVFFTPGTVC